MCNEKKYEFSRHMFLLGNKPYFILNALLLFSFAANAFKNNQTPPDSLPAGGVTTQVFGGFFINHRPHLARLQQHHAKGFEVSYLFANTGRKMWYHNFHHPTIGLCYTYLYTGSPNYLGNAHAITSILKFPFVNNNFYKLNMQAGVGLGWVTKIYDVRTNYKNVAIGSHLNCAIQLRFNNELHISKNDNVNFSVGIMHWSNGSYRTPNLGINMALIGLGYTHHFGMHAIMRDTFTRPTLPRSSISAMAVTFPKEIYPAGGPTYLGSCLSIDFERQWHIRTIYTAGLDFFYDNSLINKVADSVLSNSSFTYNTRVGAHLSFIKKLDRFEIWMQMGYYLHNRLPETLNLYHRVGIRQYISKNMFVTFNLKTHFAKADNAELGIGYKFH